MSELEKVLKQMVKDLPEDIPYSKEIIKARLLTVSESRNRLREPLTNKELPNS